MRYKVIEGFEGYRVGTDGSVWTRRGIGGQKKFSKKWRKLSLSQKTQWGHVIVRLYNGTKSTRKKALVHTLVLEAFVGPRPKGMQCCHYNGIAGDNRLKNLRWGTHQENVNDRRRYEPGWGAPRIGKGLRKGADQKNAKMTTKKVIKMRKDYAKGATIKDLASRYKISKSQTSRILRREKWKHV